MSVSLVRDDLLWTAVVVTFFVGVLLNSNELRTTFKHWPVLLLAIRVLFEPKRTPAATLIGLGLVLGAFGDWALERERTGLGSVWFLVGLAAFLAGHVLFCWAFWRTGKLFDVRIMCAALALGGSACVGVVQFGRVPAEMFAPVALYSMVLSSMLGFAFMTRNRDATLGSALFVVSDGALAVDRFVAAIPLASYIVMATYFAAQFLIARAAKNNLKHD
jgi:alkenylglycerophosphocholine hydrolase